MTSQNPQDQSVKSGASSIAKNGRMIVACAMNNQQVLQSNLALSPMIAQGTIPLQTRQGFANASAAYNDVLNSNCSDVVICAHQDIYFPNGWDVRLQAAIQSLEQAGRQWGVLGVVGIKSNKEVAGCIWCVGNNKQFGSPLQGLDEVDSIDEVVIVINRKRGVRFDSALPGYHLYATDVVLNARKMGLGAYVFFGPVVHNTVPVRWLDRSFKRAYRYMQKKWQNSLPLPNLIVPVTASGWPLRETQLRMLKQLFVGHRSRQQRLPSPTALAAQLGYEDQ